MGSDLVLHSVCECVSSKAVVFLHGVNGHWKNTWTNTNSNLFWPGELSRVTGWEVYSVQYDANTNWGQETMPLQERAASIAELLRSSPKLAKKDIAIVAHSFGGVVSKQILRYCYETERFRELRSRIAGVVFIATPHSGAAIATYGDFLKWALGSTVTLEDLRAHSPLLNDLSDWFRNANVPPAHVLYETRKLKLGFFRRWLMIVDRSSANPGIPNTALIPVDADHLEIARPFNTDTQQFISCRQFLTESFAIPANIARHSRQVAAVCYRQGITGIEFLLVRTTGKRWTFPKGSINQDLGESGSAAQEALEEAGVIGKIEHKPFTHYLHGKLELKMTSSNSKTFCVSAFLLHVMKENQRTPERGRKPKWVSVNDAKSLLSEGRSVVYIEEFERVLNEAIKLIII